MSGLPLDLVQGFAIGLSLGLLGGGGSVLTVPAPVGQKGFKAVYNVLGGTTARQSAALEISRNGSGSR